MTADNPSIKILGGHRPPPTVNAYLNARRAGARKLLACVRIRCTALITSEGCAAKAEPSLVVQFISAVRRWSKSGYAVMALTLESQRSMYPLRGRLPAASRFAWTH